MSNPANRLQSYRSYSYYHVLAMCDSTETADQLSLETPLDVWEHATQLTAAPDSRPGIQQLGLYAPKQLSTKGKYIILINGATDAAYTISKVTMSAATAAAATLGDKGTSIAIEGSMTLLEPKGISFLDQVIKCSIALGVDSSQIVFCLKTFFIGYTSEMEGDSPSDFITDVPPMTFFVTDMTGSFTEEGGVYEMEFVAASHGVARLPQYSKSVNAFSLAAGDTLSKTFDKLALVINTQYKKYFKCVQDQVKAITSIDPTPLVNLLRPVQYVINVSSDYSGANESKYKVSNQPPHCKNESPCDSNNQFTFPPHTSIETAIATIMSMCQQVQDDMGIGDTSNKVKYEYKIHTTLETKHVTSDKDLTFSYTIIYYVERFQSPKTIAYNSLFDKLMQDDATLRKDNNYANIKNNIIEFDYIYTGKNVDILEFDMKVNYGLAYLQTATMANTFKSQLERAPNRQQQTSGQDLNTRAVIFNGGPGVPLPIYFGTQLQIPHLNNTQDAGSSIQGAYTLSKHASLEVSEVSMKIYGNTQLFGTINRATSATSVANPKSPDPSKVNVFADFPDWGHIPAIAKVNIMMPRNNDDFSLFTGQSISETDTGLNYAYPFWFDGYYYVYGIDHVFDGGEFTQTLQMFGLPKKSAFDATKSNAPMEVDVNTKVESCFDNLIGCGPTTPVTSTSGASNQPNVAIPHEPPGQVPSNRADAQSINSRAQSPSDVKNWDSPNTSQAVRNAIINAAAKNPGVSTTVLAQMAYQESKFKPGVTNPTPHATATGLFQFIDSTWLGLVSQGKIKLPMKNLTPQQQLAYRTDPVINANAAAAYSADNIAATGSDDPGDTYLALFAGLPHAQTVITLDDSGNGNMLMSDAIGASAWSTVVTQNKGTGLNANTTVAAFRTWAAQTMAMTLKNPVAIGPTPPAQKQGKPTAPVSRPSSSVAPKASEKIAVVQDCATQNDKKDTDLEKCGKKVGNPEQDSKVPPVATTILRPNNITHPLNPLVKVEIRK